MNDLFTVPNILSLLRLPLIALFLSSDPFVRCMAVVCAAGTDMLDGFLARRWNLSTRCGTLLDPVTDKLFVVGVLAILWSEGRVTVVELGAFFMRDFSLFVFALWLLMKKRWQNYTIRAFLCGKISTGLQFLTLLLLSLYQTVPLFLFFTMAFFGVASFIELRIKAARVS